MVCTCPPKRDSRVSPSSGHFCLDERAHALPTHMALCDAADICAGHGHHLLKRLALLLIPGVSTDTLPNIVLYCFLRLFTRGEDSKKAVWGRSRFRQSSKKLKRLHTRPICCYFIYYKKLRPLSTQRTELKWIFLPSLTACNFLSPFSSGGRRHAAAATEGVSFS